MTFNELVEKISKNMQREPILDSNLDLQFDEVRVW